MFDNSYTDEPKTKNGVDKLDLGLEFLKLTMAINNFFTWLETEIKRPVIEDERQVFYKAMLLYTQSDPMTNDRHESMKCIFNTEFLN